MKKARLFVVAALIAIVASISLSSCQLLNQLFPPSYVGTWRQDVTYTNAPSGYPSQFRFQFQFNSDKTMQIYDYVIQPGQTQYILWTGSYQGTYSVSNGIISMTLTQAYTVTNSTTYAGSWSATSGTGTAKYSISGSTMTLTTDNNGDGVYDTSYPISGIYPGGGSGATTDITYTLTKV